MFCEPAVDKTVKNLIRMLKGGILIDVLHVFLGILFRYLSQIKISFSIFSEPELYSSVLQEIYLVYTVSSAT